MFVSSPVACSVEEEGYTAEVCSEAEPGSLPQATTPAQEAVVSPTMAAGEAKGTDARESDSNEAESSAVIHRSESAAS